MRFTSFDYAYLPFSKARQVSLLLLAVAGFYFGITINPDKPPIISPALLGAAIALHS